MQIIQMDDIKQNIELFNHGGEAYIFKNDDVIYKVFRKLDIDKYVKELKVEKLSHLEHKNLILPMKKIYEYDDFCGYTMDYFDGIHLSKIKMSKRQLIELFKKISIVLKFMHKNNIIVSDINLYNILYKDNDFRFIDLDGSQIENVYNDTISNITYRHLNKDKFVLVEDIPIDENFDNLSLIICFLTLFFDGTEPCNLTELQYKKYTDNFNRKQKILLNRVYNKPLGINLPYFDEIF